jgi:hypothetical protein
MRSSRRNIILAVSSGIALAGCGVEINETSHKTSQQLSEPPDQVLAWNSTALQIFPSQLLFSFRWLAILHSSIFDAVNGVRGNYEPFIVDEAAPAGSTENAAAAGAGYYTLTHLPYDPPLTAAEMQIITNHFNSLPASITSNPGFAFGENVAAQVLANRADDGAPTVHFTIYHAPCEGQPGCWVPQPTPTGTPAPTLVATWGNQRTWVLNDVTQFFAEPPPALDSDLYLKDLAEVQDVGFRFSTTRTTTQTNIALFWVAPSWLIWSPVARQLSEARGLSIAENARLFGLLNVAAADTYTNTWNVKFHYNFWRPITAIQHTGNTAWVPLLPATPPFPEYTSGHTSGSGAYAEVLSAFFGDNPGVPISVHSSTNTGFDHSWTTLSEGVDEVIDARVYSGIHFRNSDVVGARFGKKIAHYVVTHAMRDNPGHR